MKFDLRFEHSKINQILQKSLITDRHGKLYLGKLDNILKLAINGNGLTRNWDISGTKSDFWKYPTSMNLLQGGSFSLPIKDMWDPTKPNELLRQQFYFCKRINGETIEDCFPKLKLSPANDPKVHYRLLETDNLEPGDYELKVQGSNPFSMDITVHMG